jgi:hypothetical protein
MLMVARLAPTAAAESHRAKAQAANWKVTAQSQRCWSDG